MQPLYGESAHSQYIEKTDNRQNLIFIERNETRNQIITNSVEYKMHTIGSNLNLTSCISPFLLELIAVLDGFSPNSSCRLLSVLSPSNIRGSWETNCHVPLPFPPLGTNLFTYSVLIRLS
ncbi:hypothetical protein H113_07574 [Trichophyton rubrum MR1459]|uniref:Uncharacterized protein n=1 Tax=Trichophyton rubrum (strain ATCC MYA-4607 / CBS 118892) TaxID=559305 RepID=A0A087PFG4_TRIRC|nr:uncharacterized protein TERG_11515 [Trichophyton rubrum CBS 118892]EZF91498.1 hypothetical protein H113_07574 [Trichophyton rubrum MR1459]EZG02506.1 hypothetical protein H106_07351 [Trichophyton rubrum CBS 735.88]KFL60117.1 hypothetical protein TERG_11515 [Trichophyton rubrum CBS 118892]